MLRRQRRQFRRWPGVLNRRRTPLGRLRARQHTAEVQSRECAGSHEQPQQTATHPAEESATAAPSRRFRRLDARRLAPRFRSFDRVLVLIPIARLHRRDHHPRPGSADEAALGSWRRRLVGEGIDIGVFVERDRRRGFDSPGERSRRPIDVTAALAPLGGSRGGQIDAVIPLVERKRSRCFSEDAGTVFGRGENHALGGVVRIGVRGRIEFDLRSFLVGGRAENARARAGESLRVPIRVEQIDTGRIFIGDGACAAPFARGVTRVGAVGENVGAGKLGRVEIRRVVGMGEALRHVAAAQVVERPDHFALGDGVRRLLLLPARDMHCGRVVIQAREQVFYDLGFVEIRLGRRGAPVRRDRARGGRGGIEPARSRRARGQLLRIRLGENG